MFGVRASIFAAIPVLFLSLIAPAAPASAQAQCASLLSAINQLRAQIPREPRDAAEADAQVLSNYVGLYNRACTGGGGGGVPRGGGNNAPNALGAAGDLLGALGDLLEQMDERQRAAAEEAERAQEQAEIEAALEEAQRDAEARAAAAAARAAQAADDANRQAMANPFDQTAGKSANPFDTPVSRQVNATGASRGGFKTDAQIKRECAAAVDPGFCAAALKSERGENPAYRTYVAQQKKQMDRQVAARQKAVDDAFAKFDRERAQRRPPEQVGSLPKILAGALPPDDDGLECGNYKGRRRSGQCFAPWSGSPDSCTKDLGGTYYPADDDHPTAFCATSAKPNPMTAWPGPNEGESCGDAGGHMHGGACWVLGITRDDCRDQLHGFTIDNGGYQYCAYDAAQLAKEEKLAEAASAARHKRNELADKLRKLLAAPDDDAAAQPSGGAPAAASQQPVKTAAATPSDAGGTGAGQAWTPHYTCRLPDGTVTSTEDPLTIPGYDPTHSFCRLDNGEAIPGLTPGADGK